MSVPSTARIYGNTSLRSPAKDVEPYEDFPITDGILTDFISFVPQDKAFYFLLTPKTGTIPQNVLPDKNAQPAVLNPLNLKDEEFKDKGPLRCRYLYAIDSRGIHLGLEQSRSIARRGRITHTNLCKKAYFAGEVFFLSRDRVILTPNSGRFGLSFTGPNSGLHRYQLLWKMTIECWKICGFIVHPTIEDVNSIDNIDHRVWNGRALAAATAEMFAQQSS